ncbi:MAG: hypothetical protein ACE5KX_03875 [Acidimicrobiia bacterium]
MATGFDPGVGACWYLSRYPPGIDTWESGADPLIASTVASLAACPSASRPGGLVPPAINVIARAWQVFRSFPLSPPDPKLQPPDAGITGLPTYLAAVTPEELDHDELLPSGIALQVRARVTNAIVDWGDGSPAISYGPDALAPYPWGHAARTYALKTCDPNYRAEHPSGVNCHPTLASYPISVTFVWTGSYRYGGGWIELGDLNRTTVVDYDVDEVVGVIEGQP